MPSKVIIKTNSFTYSLVPFAYRSNKNKKWNVSSSTNFNASTIILIFLPYMLAYNKIPVHFFIQFLLCFLIMSLIFSGTTTSPIARLLYCPYIHIHEEYGCTFAYRPNLINPIEKSITIRYILASIYFKYLFKVIIKLEWNVATIRIVFLVLCCATAPSKGQWHTISNEYSLSLRKLISKISPMRILLL